jgi:RNase P subunit RPR2
VLTPQQEKQRSFLKEQPSMILSRLKRLVGTSANILHARFVHWTKPLTSSMPLGTLADLARSKSELLAENALLRQQLIILKRQVKRPACKKTDRILLVLLARAVRAWKQTLFLVQEDNSPALAS